MSIYPIDILANDTEDIHEVVSILVDATKNNTPFPSILGIEKPINIIQELGASWDFANYQQKQFVGTAICMSIRILNEEREQHKLENVVGFNKLLFLYSSIAHELPKDIIADTIPLLRTIIDLRATPLSKTAAICLAANQDIASQSILEDHWSKNPNDKWIASSLLLARSRTVPMNSLKFEPEQINSLELTPEISLSIEQCVDSMLNDNFSLTLKTIKSICVDWPQQFKEQVATSLFDIGSKTFPEIRDFISEFMDPKSGVEKPPNSVLQLISEITQQLSVPSPNWDTIYDTFVNAWSNEKLRNSEAENAHLNGYIESLSYVANGPKALSMFVKSVFDGASLYGGSFEPAEKVKFVQKRFFSAKLGNKATSRSFKEISEKLENRYDHISANITMIPDSITIARMEYAEDAYIELLAIILQAAFPNMEILSDYSVKWDKIDDALAMNQVDLAINNDDLIRRGSLNPGKTIYKLAGDEFFNFDSYTVLANSDWLQAQGVSITGQKRVSPNGIFNHYLFDDSPEDKINLTKALKGARITLSENMVLEEVANTLYEQNSLAAPRFSGATSEQGMRMFLNGEVDLYLGGTIHSYYAFNHWTNAVPLVHMSDCPAIGRIYAANNLIDDYKDFSNALPKVIDAVIDLWNHLDKNFYANEIKGHLVNYINLQRSNALSLAAVMSFEDLYKVVSVSQLSGTRSNGHWEKATLTNNDNPAETDYAKIVK